MKIIVLVKQVPTRDGVLRISANGAGLDEAGVTYEMNGPDAYALEAGLQLREKWGGEVVVLSAGPERVTQTIREALAKGAERGIHVKLPAGQFPDPFAVARAMSEAMRTETPDLCLTGLQSEDVCSGQTGVIIAELLGFAHATIVTEAALAGSGEVRVKRELEGGRYQYMTLPLPAVLTTQSGSHKPRLATMMGIKQAKTREIRVVAPSKPQQEQTFTTTERIYVPEQKNKAKILTGEARDCARRLVDQLRFEARVL